MRQFNVAGQGWAGEARAEQGVLMMYWAVLLYATPVEHRCPARTAAAVALRGVKADPDGNFRSSYRAGSAAGP